MTMSMQQNVAPPQALLPVMFISAGQVWDMSVQTLRLRVEHQRVYPALVLCLSEPVPPALRTALQGSSQATAGPPPAACQWASTRLRSTDRSAIHSKRTLCCEQSGVPCAGFCKQQLWPLFHYLLPLSPTASGRFDPELWQAYVKANKAFADKLVEVGLAPLVQGLSRMLGLSRTSWWRWVWRPCLDLT